MVTIRCLRTVIKMQGKKTTSDRYHIKRNRRGPPQRLTVADILPSLRGSHLLGHALPNAEQEVLSITKTKNPQAGVPEFKATVDVQVTAGDEMS
jgi:hypothetical protein